jgi:hypothetical protein
VDVVSPPGAMNTGVIAEGEGEARVKLPPRVKAKYT